MNKIKTLFIAGVVSILNAGTAFSVEIPEEMKSVMAQDPIATPGALHLVVSMVLVIAMIYLTSWIYSKLNIINRKKLKEISKSDFSNYNFNIVQSASLGQQRHLYSIEMGGKILLVGSTPSQITLLKEFDYTTQNKENDEFTSTSEEKWTNSKSLDIDELYRKYKN